MGKVGKNVLCLETVPWEVDEYMRAELRQEGKKNMCISKIKSKARNNGNARGYCVQIWEKRILCSYLNC